MCEKPFTRIDLESLIKDLLGITEIPFLIKRQIREYIERGWTYKGIARALCYMVDQKKRNLREDYKQFGIGIISSRNGEVYKEAQDYYEKIRAEQNKNAERQQNIINQIQSSGSIIINCRSGDKNKKITKKYIDISQL